MAPQDFIPDSEFQPDQQPTPQPAPVANPAQASGQPADFIPENQFVDDEEKYGTTSEMAKTAIEGVGKGLAGPLFTGAETALFHNAPEQLGRAAANPFTHGASEVAGFIGPAVVTAGASALGRAGVAGAAEAANVLSKAAEFSQAGVLEKAGNGIIKGLNLGGKEASILGKIGAKSVSEAAQMALLQGGDEVSKMIQSDPNQTAETAAVDIGLAGLIGGGAGAVFGAVSPLWKASVGDKAAKFVEDFKGELKFGSENSDPVQAVKDELTQHYRSTKDYSDEVFGPTGLKAEAIAKAMPEMHTGISEQAQKFANVLEDKIVSMELKPNSYPERLVSKARDDWQAFSQAIQDPKATPESIFNATQDLKQTFQGYAKFDKFVKPVDEAYDFVRESKELARSLREGLEDSNVWDKAADIQKKINGAFTDYLPTLKDFEKKFTSELNGERVIDPAKIQTYINQLGKPNAELKQSMLENFLKESEAYRKVISDTHAGLGVESPIQPSSLAVTRHTLEDLTPGGKLAQYFLKKGIYHLAGETLGTSIGGAVGHLLGSGAAGAVVGERALAPFFASVLPALVKPFQDKVANSAGVKAAIDYGLAAARGETIINKAAKGVFREAGENVIRLVPHEGDRVKLDKALKTAQTDPESLLKVGGDIGHFLPQHATALAETSGRAVQYLNSLRPNTDPQRPLDAKMPPSAPAQAAYNRALDLANQPLLAVEAIRKGTLTPQDVQTVAAVYPSLYQKLSQKLLSEVTDKSSKGDLIPYRQRLQLSLFLDQPLDSTMTPQAIVAAQPQAPQQQNQPSSGGSSKPPAGNSVKGLNKLSQLAATPSQSRAAARAEAKA